MYWGEYCSSFAFICFLSNSKSSLLTAVLIIISDTPKHIQKLCPQFSDFNQNEGQIPSPTFSSPNKTPEVRKDGSSVVSYHEVVIEFHLPILFRYSFALLLPKPDSDSLQEPSNLTMVNFKTMAKGSYQVHVSCLFFYFYKSVLC